MLSLFVGLGFTVTEAEVYMKKESSHTIIIIIIIT